LEWELEKGIPFTKSCCVPSLLKNMNNYGLLENLIGNLTSNAPKIRKATIPTPAAIIC
jgi:hypothetical protein